MARAAVQEETGGIAVEQRSVRANFIFLMGGHVEDEEEEAQHSSEIQVGRLENMAQREMSRAVGYMTSAEQSLIGVDTSAALRWARLAADALQRAFGRNRYILRTLPVRSRIDASRRLSGELTEARGGERDTNRMSPEPDDARRLLADLLAVAAQVRRDPRSTRMMEQLTAATERALLLDQRSPSASAVGDLMLRLRTLAAERGRSAEVDRQFDAVIAALSERARVDALHQNVLAQPRDRLRGAWAEEARQR